jgi:hypothetical protein
MNAYPNDAFPDLVKLRASNLIVVVESEIKHENIAKNNLKTRVRRHFL